jgi:hypothetical protein
MQVGFHQIGFMHHSWVHGSVVNNLRGILFVYLSLAWPPLYKELEGALAPNP